MKDELIQMDIDKSNFSEWYNQILELADIIDLRYPVKGMPVYKKWGFKLLRNSFRILEEELEKRGHEQMLFPLLIPEDQFGKEAEHIKGFESEVLWTTHAGLERTEKKLAVRPTSETVMYPMFALWIRSHTDLPLKIHQTVCVYRYETKATKPLIRGREVYWNETHTAHVYYEDAEAQIKEAYEIYKNFYNKLCIPFIALKRPEYDKFAGAVYSIALDTLFPDGKVLQIGTIHNLGENFSRVYEIKFNNEKGERKYVSQTCYGISMRCLAALISIHGDNKGLVLPPSISPIQVIIIPIFFKEKKGILEKCRELFEKLKENGIRTQIDEKNIRPGEKFYFWEGLGIPLRIEIGPKDIENEEVVLATRFGEKRKIPEKNILEVKNELKIFEEKLLKRAEENLYKHIFKSENLEELKAIVKNKGGFIEAGWCEKKECAEKIKEEIGAEIRGAKYFEAEKKKKCIVCGAEGICVFVGKAY